MPHTLNLFNIFREYDGKENCAQVLEEECIKMLGSKSLNDEHDCNVVSMNSLNIHDANDMQSHKLGEAMFDEDDIFENIFAEINVCPKLGDATFNEYDIFCPQVLMRIFIMMKAFLLFMMIILMKVGLEECQL